MQINDGKGTFKITNDFAARFNLLWKNKKTTQKPSSSSSTYSKDTKRRNKRSLATAFEEARVIYRDYKGDIRPTKRRRMSGGMTTRAKAKANKKAMDQSDSENEEENTQLERNRDRNRNSNRDNANESEINEQIPSPSQQQQQTQQPSQPTQPSSQPRIPPKPTIQQILQKLGMTMEQLKSAGETTLLGIRMRCAPDEGPVVCDNLGIEQLRLWIGQQREETRKAREQARKNEAEITVVKQHLNDVTERLREQVNREERRKRVKLYITNNTQMRNTQSTES